MRILIMGAGGLGGYFGGLLARAGQQVMFVARGAHLHALRTRGLVVRSANGDFTVQVQVCDDPAGQPPADMILFCVKTYDAPAALALLQPVVAPHSIILTLQNGVDTPGELQTAFGRGAVVAGVTRIGATRIAPGVIEQPTADRTIEIGVLHERHQPQLERVRTLLEASGIPTVVASDIVRGLWEKLVFISAFSGLSTLTRLAVAQLLAREPTRELYRTVMQETASVAWKAQIAVAADIVERTMVYLDAQDDPGDASMAVDFRRGQRIEVEAIHGAIVRHGKRLHVPTPVNDTLYATLVVMDQYNRSTTPTSQGHV